LQIVLLADQYSKVLSLINSFVCQFFFYFISQLNYYITAEFKQEIPIHLF